MRPSLLLLLSIVAITGCTPQPVGDGPAVAVAPGDPPSTAVPPPTQPKAILPDGAVVALELAITPEERRQGLMYRPALPENRGMLLLFDRTGIWSLWMKDTHVPLDMIFLDEAGVVADLTLRAQPCAEEPCPQYVPREPVRAVLEVAAGTVDRHGVEIGQQLEFEGVPGYPTATITSSSTAPGS